MSKEKYDRANRRRIELLETNAALADMDVLKANGAEAVKRVTYTAAPARPLYGEPVPPTSVHSTPPREWGNPDLERVRRERNEWAEAARRRTFRRRLTIAIGAAMLAVLMIAVMARVLTVEEKTADRAETMVSAMPVGELLVEKWAFVLDTSEQSMQQSCV